jgi:hypothetical protein
MRSGGESRAAATSPRSQIYIKWREGGRIGLQFRILLKIFIHKWYLLAWNSATRLIYFCSVRTHCPPHASLDLIIYAARGPIEVACSKYLVVNVVKGQCTGGLRTCRRSLSQRFIIRCDALKKKPGRGKQLDMTVTEQSGVTDFSDMTALVL